MRFIRCLSLLFAIPAFASTPTPPPDSDDIIVSAVQVSASADVAAPELEQHVITTAGMELAATTQHHEEVTAMQTPTIGRIVHYRLTEKDAESINRRRVETDRAGVLDQNGVRLWPDGAQRHVGNTACAGELVPLTVSKVWPEEYAGGAYLAHHESGTKYESSFGVNGQATLDGNDSLWVCSAPQHATLDGCWSWPAKV